MEPISALLVIAGSHGAVALVKALTGVDELGELTGELVRALTASESRIDERLDRIESGLDELLDQSYSVAVRRGVRYLLDATGSTGSVRTNDLDRARDAFVEATAAARGALQRAVAERYLLLTLLGLGRHDAVPASVARVEEHATANAFDALRTSEHSQDAVSALIRREGGRASGERLTRARQEVKQSALESIGVSARLMAEMAVVRPVLGLSAVTAPPVEPLIDNTVMTVTLTESRGGVTVDSTGSTTGVPYWTFAASPSQPLRLGSMTVTVSPHPAPATAMKAPAFAAPRPLLRPDHIVGGHVRVEVSAPLPVAVALVSTPTAGAAGRAVNVADGSLPSGALVGYAPLPPSADGTSWLRITPQYVHRALIEVACRL